MRALCIDPGSKKSAYVLVEVDLSVLQPPWGIVPLGGQHTENLELRELLKLFGGYYDHLVIETMPTVFGGAAARDQLSCERWAGRFMEAYLRERELETGGEVAEGSVIEVAGAQRRAAVLGTSRGNDSMNRRALIDLYGGDAAAFGKKCTKCKGKGWYGQGRPPCDQCSGEGWDPPRGPLHGWTGTHLYAALGCALAAFQPGGPGRPLQRKDGSGELASSLRPGRSVNRGRRVPPAPSLEELEG